MACSLVVLFHVISNLVIINAALISVIDGKDASYFTEPLRFALRWWYFPFELASRAWTLVARWWPWA